jgi:hypothetical protein
VHIVDFTAGVSPTSRFRYPGIAVQFVEPGVSICLLFNRKGGRCLMTWEKLDLILKMLGIHCDEKLSQCSILAEYVWRTLICWEPDAVVLQVQFRGGLVRLTGGSTQLSLHLGIN